MHKNGAEQLMQFISEVGFAIVDITLYLDTHPCDKDALKYYQKYRDLRAQAVAEYTRLYGPLTADQVETDCYWTWIEGPWPWKGGK